MGILPTSFLLCVFHKILKKILYNLLPTYYQQFWENFSPYKKLKIGNAILRTQEIVKIRPQHARPAGRKVNRQYSQISIKSLCKMTKRKRLPKLGVICKVSIYCYLASGLQNLEWKKFPMVRPSRGIQHFHLLL